MPNCEPRMVMLPTRNGGAQLAVFPSLALQAVAKAKRAWTSSACAAAGHLMGPMAHQTKVQMMFSSVSARCDLTALGADCSGKLGSVPKPQ